MEKNIVKNISIMPRINDYEEFNKYLLKARKELNIKVRWDIKAHTLKFNNDIIYFNSYIDCMCFIEGYRKGLENASMQGR